jgi:hypothetical protein
MWRFDRIIEKREISRSQAVNILVAHVLKNDGMLAGILDKEGMVEAEEALASIVPLESDALQLFLQSQSGNLYKPEQSLELPTPAARRDLPEPSRMTTSEPLPEPRSPRYVCTRGNITPRHYREKTKNELREELRQAVENTR